LKTEVLTVKNPILQAKNIYKSFGSNNVLEDVSIEFHAGEVHALIGVNGAGKSTLVKIMQGVYRCDQGTLVLNGNVVNFNGPHDAMGQGIAMVFQELNLFQEMTVTENIMIGDMVTQNGKIQWAKCHKIVQDLLDSLNVKVDAHSILKNLSLAQQQLVEIAKSVYRNPKVLFLDEPSSSLSQSEEIILYQLVRDLKSKGITIVLITHKMDEIFALCDQITILRDGKNVSSGPVGDYTLEDITQHMLGKAVEIFKKSNITHGNKSEVVLSVQNLSYSNKVNNVSFNLYAGEILAITGLVGSGKSDVARTLFGVNRNYSGTISLNGQPVKLVSPIQASKLGIGHVPISRKDEGILENFSVGQNITATILDDLGFIIDKKMEEQVSTDMVEQFNVMPRNKDIGITFLSGGNQQKAILSRWIAGRKRLILLDEPTRGVDVGAKQEIYDNLKRLAQENIGIIIFSSETEELLSSSDRILIMRQGEIIKELITAQTTSSEILQYSMAGIAQ
jgi:ABC-type sugar transport system ATPase subunit